MTQKERDILRSELERMMINSIEVRDSYEGSPKTEVNIAMINYERGMIRGLERALSTIEDLEAIKEDYRMKLKEVS